jgi:ATP-dependent Clp protease ATP-binding subunit ClpA
MIREQVEKKPQLGKILVATKSSSNLAELPFSDECWRALVLSAEEADKMNWERIEPGHLILGLLQEEACFASRLLRGHGADFERIRKELATALYQPLPREEKIRSAAEQMRKILASAPQLPPRNPEESSDAMSRFVHYTEKARRTIFFARYEASQFFSPAIETEHLLLGVLREDRAHLDLYLPSSDSIATIRKQIEEHSATREKSLPGERLPARMNFPLSDECERALAYAEEEAGKLGHERIVPAHLILGLLREEGSFAAQLLREHGAEIERIRIGLKASHDQPPSNPADPSQPSEPAA